MMDLLEILNTKPEVTWAESSGNYAGLFKLDGENFLVSIDTIPLDGQLIADIGFKRNGSMDFVDSSKNATKIMSTVMNALSDKLKQIAPDIITIIVHNDFGAAESRMHSYGLFIRRMAGWKGHVKYWGDWIPFSSGHVMVIGRTFSPTPEEEKKIVNVIKSK
jgi:hypothetical protein